MTMLYRVTSSDGTSLSRWFETRAQAEGFLTKSFVANADPALQPSIEEPTPAACATPSAQSQWIISNG